MHQTQVQAYREAAVKGLREWAQSEASLEPMEDNDTEDTFVERCVTAVVSNSSWPNWRLDSAKMVAIIEIRKRARATFAKYHPITNVVEETPTTAESTKPAMDTNQTQDNNKENADNTNEDVEDAAAADDDGEVEDGEMDDDDQDEDGQVDENEATKSSSDNGPKKKAMNAKNNNSTTNNNKKKVVVRKKATNIKQGPPRKGGPANRGGRRPGRGGSNAGGTKSG